MCQKHLACMHQPMNDAPVRTDEPRQVSLRTQICRPLPSLFPSFCPSFCLSRGLHEWIGALSLSHDSKEHYWRWMLLKKEIDDGYEAGHVIHHFEYYLDWPCKAVTWAGLREREREGTRESSEQDVGFLWWMGRALALFVTRYQRSRTLLLTHSPTHSYPIFFLCLKGHENKTRGGGVRKQNLVFLFVIAVAS